MSIFPVSDRISSLADAVQQAYGDYGELSYLRRLLKYLKFFRLLARLYAAVDRRPQQPVADMPATWPCDR